MLISNSCCIIYGRAHCSSKWISILPQRKIVYGIHFEFSRNMLGFFFVRFSVAHSNLINKFSYVCFSHLFFCLFLSSFPLILLHSLGDVKLCNSKLDEKMLLWPITYNSSNDSWYRSRLTWRLMALSEAYATTSN